jgi:predicted Ser/Thr protein kinase
MTQQEAEERLYSAFRDFINYESRYTLINEGHVYPSVWLVEENQNQRVLSGSQLAEYLEYYASLLVEYPNDFGEEEIVQALLNLCSDNSQGR